MDTIDTVNAHNKLYNEGKETYFLGVNHFADLKPEEVPTGVVKPIAALKEVKVDWEAYKVSISFLNVFLWIIISSLQTEYAKTYEPEVDAARKLVYLDAVKRINEHNKLYNSGVSSFSLKLNQYSDSPTGAPTGLLIPREENH